MTVCKKCDKVSNALFNGICDDCAKKERMFKKEVFELRKKQRNYVRRPDKKLMDIYPTRSQYFKEKYG